jgi:hypothetical protein
MTLPTQDSNDLGLQTFGRTAAPKPTSPQSCLAAEFFLEDLGAWRDASADHVPKAGWVGACAPSAEDLSSRAEAGQRERLSGTATSSAACDVKPGGGAWRTNSEPCPSPKYGWRRGGSNQAYPVPKLLRQACASVAVARRKRPRGPLSRRAEELTVRTKRSLRSARPSNGSDVKLRGQGPRGYGSAARRLPAFEVRDADGVTPPKYR